MALPKRFLCTLCALFALAGLTFQPVPAHADDTDADVEQALAPDQTQEQTTEEEPDCE